MLHFQIKTKKHMFTLRWDKLRLPTYEIITNLVRFLCFVLINTRP